MSEENKDIIGQILWYLMFFMPIICVVIFWKYFKVQKALRIIIGLILGIICIVWMYIKTKKYQTKDRWVWLILAFVIPVPTVLIYYFTQMRNKSIN